MSETSVCIELDGVEFDITFEYEYSHQAAKLTGPWEDSWPEEEEFWFEPVIDHRRFNAIELDELGEVKDEVYLTAALEDCASDRMDAAEYRAECARDEKVEVFYDNFNWRLGR